MYRIYLEDLKTGEVIPLFVDGQDRIKESVLILENEETCINYFLNNTTIDKTKYTIAVEKMTDSALIPITQQYAM